MFGFENTSIRTFFIILHVPNKERKIRRNKCESKSLQLLCIRDFQKRNVSTLRCREKLVWKIILSPLLTRLPEERTKFLIRLARQEYLLQRKGSIIPEISYAIALTIRFKNRLCTHFCDSDCDSYSFLKARSYGAMCNCDLLHQEMECCLRFSNFVHKVRWVWMRFPILTLKSHIAIVQNGCGT